MTTKPMNTFTADDPVIHAHDTVLVGRFVKYAVGGYAVGGYAVVRWHGATSNIRVPSANLRKEATIEPFQENQRVVHSSQTRMPGTITAIRQEVTVKYDDQTEPITYTPGLAAKVLHHYVPPLPEEPAMATGLDPQTFPEGARVRSRFHPYKGLVGSVTTSRRADGQTLVTWDGNKQETRQPTASLYLDPDQPHPNAPAVGIELPPAAGDAYLTIYGEPGGDVASYHLPAVTVEEVAAKRGVTYKTKEFPNGIHDSVGLEYCLETAAMWAAVAHRIATKEKAEQEQLEAEAQALWQAYTNARDVTGWGVVIEGAMKDPAFLAAWVAVAKAARKLDGDNK